MRLLELDAEFVGEYTSKTHRQLESVDGAQGVMFQCPHCAQGLKVGGDERRKWVEGAHYVLCWFANPRNALKVPDDAFPLPGRWTFTGETLDTLTLNPSVHVTGPGCGWHGWVKDGDAT